MNKICIALCVPLLVVALVQADPPASQPASKLTTPSAPAKVIVDQSSPKALLISVHQASVAIDYEALIRCYDPALQPVMETVVDIGRTLKHMFAVMDKKLGKAAQELRKGAESFGPVFDSPLAAAVVNGEVDWTKVSIEEKGDKANIVVGGKSFLEKRIEAKWYWLDEQEPDPDDIKQTLQELRKSLANMKTLCQGVEKGLEDGSITKDNFNEEMEKLGKAAKSTATTQAAPKAK